MAVNRQQLGRRLMTAAVGVPAAIVFSLVGGWGFLIVINFVLGVGLFEFYRMMECKGIKPYKTVGILAGLGVSWYVYFQEGVFSSLFVTAVIALVMIMELFRRDGELAVFHISTTILGVFYACTNALRAIGDTRTPFFIMLIINLSNVILSACFVGVAAAGGGAIGPANHATHDLAGQERGSLAAQVVDDVVGVDRRAVGVADARPKGHRQLGEVVRLVREDGDSEAAVEEFSDEMEDVLFARVGMAVGLSIEGDGSGELPGADAERGDLEAGFS